jgi:hypothetical protein
MTLRIISLSSDTRSKSLTAQNSLSAKNVKVICQFRIKVI